MRTIAVIATVCMTALVAEIVMRVITPAPAPSMYIEHPVLSHINRPGYVGTVQTPEYRTDIQINGAGCRGPEIPTDVVILGIGDSFTFAQQVPYDSTWISLVGRHFDSPVVNAGVNNYGPQQELDWLRIIGAQTHPQLVIVQMFDNDVTDITRTQQLPRWLWEPLHWSALYQFTKHRIDLLRHSRRDNSAVVFYSDSREALDGWQRIESCYSQMRRWCDLRRIPLLAVYIPHPCVFESTVTFNPTLQAVRFNNAMYRCGIYAVNGYEVFRQHPDPTVLYYPLDGHLTAAGHHVLADAIIRRMQ